MPRKAPQTPGAAPETAAAKAETAGTVTSRAVDEVLAAEAAPVSREAAQKIDPSTLKRSVFIEGEGWLCPTPKQSTTHQAR